MRLRWLVPLMLSSISLAQSFTVQNSTTTENLRGLNAVSSSVIWASGTHGTYLRTVDGGTTWTAGQVAGAETLDFRDVQAFSADEAYLLAAGPGDQSRIYKTVDAGKTWALQFTNAEPKGFFDCMAFWDRTHGIALGDPVDGEFELIVTEDGERWHTMPEAIGPRALAEEGAFAASGTCLVTQGTDNVWFVTGGFSARVFRSSNRGATWSAADVPLVKDNASAGAFSLAFDGQGRAVIGGGDYQHAERKPTLAYSDDRGITWQNLSFGSSRTSRQWRSIPPIAGIYWQWAAHTPRMPTIWAADLWRAYWELNLNAATFVGPGEAIAVGPKGNVVQLQRAVK